MLPAIPGQPVNLSAGDYNDAVDTGRWYRRERRLSGGGSSPVLPIGSTIVQVQNDTGGDLDAGAVVEIDDTILTTPSNQFPWFSAIARAGNDPVCAVLLDPIPEDGVGPAVLAGIVFADVDIVDEDNTHARVVPGSTQLKGDFGGWCRIVYKPSGTGVKSCAVLVGGLDNVIRKARSTSTITDGGSGTANIYLNGSARGSVTIYFNWFTGTGNIASGTDLWVKYFHDEDKWVVTGAECGA